MIAARFGLGSPIQLRVLLIHLVVVAVFGVWLPWLKGLEFTDPVMLSAYACLSVVFAAPASAQAFGEGRPASMTEGLWRVVSAVIYGEVMMVAILGAGLFTVYMEHRHGAWLPPDVAGLAEAVGLGIAASFALASFAGWITVRASAKVARLALRLVFIGLLCLFFFRARWLPDVTLPGTLLSLGLTAGFLFLLGREVR